MIFGTNLFYLQKLFSMNSRKSRRVSIKDIAKEVGVSPALVSFVLNGKQKQYRVSDQMAEKIREAVKRLDYKPNGFAKSLREGTNNTIGVIVSDISNPFFANVVKTIETTAEDRGYLALFASSDENADKLANLLDRMLSKEVEGVIVVPCEGSEDTIRTLIDKRIPTVLLDRYIPELRTNYVCLDNKKAAHDATEVLIKKGHNKIGLICYGLKLSNMKGRVDGYMEAMNNYGLKDEAKIIHVNMGSLETSCMKALNKLISEGYESIVCATNSITVACLRGIQELRLNVPNDIDILGFDGGNEFDFYNAPLTFMTQPIEMIAKKSVDILINQLQSSEGYMTQIEAEGSIFVHTPPTINQTFN